MNRIIVLLAAMSLTALPSLAQNARSFVATTGNDANTCTRNNECRTFARAICDLTIFIAKEARHHVAHAMPLE